MIEKIASGKVREIYAVDEDKLLIVTTDRISAFDVILPTCIEDKGKVLNRLSLFWFDYTKDLVPGHVLSDCRADFPKDFQTSEFEGRSVLVKKLKIVPYECIVRGYLAGSGWENYQKTGQICSIDLPVGLAQSQKLPQAIFTPSSKAAQGHDMDVSYDDMKDDLGEELASRIRETSLAVYETCAQYALSRGIIIADTKFEFGLDESGALVLADEVLTPDSSRFWPLDGYKEGQPQPSYDKQFVRDWLKSQNAAGKQPAPELPEEVVRITRDKYIGAYEALTGKMWK